MPTPEDSPVTKADLNGLEERTKADLNGLEERTKAGLAALEERILERIEKTETNMLRAFRNWAVGSETRLKVNELLVHSFNERLTAAEERLGEVERKLTK